MKAIAHRVSALLIALLFAGGLAAAQTPQPASPAPGVDGLGGDYQRIAWTTEDGLPQNSVLDIGQTRDGYLWLATFGGLARFDGVRFTVYDVVNAPGLASNRMTALYEDRAGVLWIGHETGELNRYADGVFTAYTAEDGLPGGTVHAFAEDQAGALWIGTQQGLVRHADGVFTTYTMRDGLPVNEVFSLLADRAGRLWIGTDDGLARYEAGRFETYTRADGLPGITVSELFEDSEGRLWVGTGGGLAYYRGNRFVPYAPAEGGRWLIKGIAADRKDGLWVGMGMPRQLLRLGGAITTPGVPPVMTARILFDRIIQTVFKDQEGNLWVGTDGSGLHQIREKPVRRYTTADGLRHNSVFRVIGDGEGGLLFNTGCDNLTRFRNGTFTTYETLPGGGKIGCVWALLRDRAGVFWVGSDDGVVRWEGTAYTRYRPADGLPGGDVVVLFEDREGMLWIGTTGHGVARFDGTAFRIYTTEDGLAHGDVRVITQDRGGTLWFGTREGVSRYQDGVFTSYTAEDGLSPGTVRAIHEDAEGTLWVGTYGGGLSRLKDGTITRYAMDDGLFDNVVSQILEDERGNLWMLGNLGLFFVNRQALNDFAEGRRGAIESVSLGPEEGMAEGNGGGQPSGWQTDDGRMYFATIAGLAVVDAKHFSINTTPPPVVVERAAIDERAFDLRQPVEAPPGKRDVEVQYTALSFAAPHKVRFRYRLDGHDAAWHEAGDRRVAYYTNLGPGRYTFRVQAANNDGVWNEQGASLALALKPYVYETLWFYALVMLLLGWAGYTASRLRTRAIHARNVRLQAEIIERRRVEEALQESEERYRRLLEFAPMPLSVVRMDGTIAYVNQAMLELLGVSAPDEVLGTRVSDYLGEQESKEAHSRITKIAEGQQVEPVERTLLRRDGETRTILATSLPIVYQGEPAAQSVLIDITERKQAEEALQASEVRYRAVVETQTELITRSLPDTTLTFVNDAYCRYFEKPREALIGQSFLSLVAPEFREQTRAHIAALAKDKKTVVYIHEVLRPDGTTAWQEWIDIPICDETGRVVEFQSTGRDITARKQAEEALRESLAFSERLIQSLPDGFSVVDTQGRHTQVNAALCRMTGFSEEELLGVGPPHPYWAPEAYPAIEEAFQQTLAGQFDDFELLFMRKGGERFSVIVSPAQLTNDHGEVVARFAVVKDITERKHAEEELRRSEENNRLLVENAPYCIHQIDRQGRLFSMNAAGLRMMGTADEAAIKGMPYLDAVSNKDRERIAGLLDAALHGDGSEFEFEASNGSHFVSSFIPIFGEDGAVARLMGLTRDITERKRAEEAIKENEARLHALVENVRHYIWSIDTRYSLLTINSNLQQLYQMAYGVRLDVGDNILEKTPDQKVAALFKGLYDRALEGEQFSIELPAELEGQTVYLEVFLNPIRSGDGTIRGLSAFAQDITERKRAEDALRASEERFSKAFQAAPVPMVLTTVAEGRCIDVNQNALALFGFERDEVVGKTAKDMAFWEDPEERGRMLTLMQKQGFVRDMEARFRTKAGDVRDNLVSVEFVKIGGQQCLLIVGQDITERKRAEQELRASEERFSKAFQSSPDAILITSIPGGIILNVNQGFTRISGYKPEEAIGKTTRAIKIWHNPAERDRMFQTLKTQGSIQEMEIGVRVKSGARRTCLHSAEIVEIDGKSCLLSVVRDITERKQAAEEREALIAELEARNAELERFTYTVSHDLKTPLVTIKGFLGMLRKDVAAGNAERMEQDIKQIGTAADRMARLLRELLDLSRIGRQVNPAEAIPLDDLVGEALELVAGQRAEHEIAIALDTAGLAVRGDRVRLLEVYQNLLDNAIQFRGAQPAPRIEIGAQPHEGGVLCYVRDNGRGIDAQYHERIFELFERLDHDAEGTGIGLALVRRIVEVHGGRIWVESEGEGHGSTFWFILPHGEGCAQAVPVEPLSG